MHPSAGAESGSVLPEPGSGHCLECSCSVVAMPALHGEIVVLRIVGEIDLLSHPTLEAALTEQLHAKPRHLVVDIAGVTFCGVRGFTLLADTATAAAAGETRFAVSGLSATLDRIATMLWEGSELIRYRTAARAVTAILADHVERDQSERD